MILKGRVYNGVKILDCVKALNYRYKLESTDISIIIGLRK